MADQSAAASSSGDGAELGRQSAAAALEPQAEHLRSLAAQLQAALGNPGERESMLTLLRQLGVADPPAVSGASRSERPGDGFALLYSSSKSSVGPLAAAAPALAPIGASVHTPVGSIGMHSTASATSSSRSYIMRHSQHAVSDDVPFSAAPEKAFKAPELTEASHYHMWRSTFFTWLNAYGLGEIVTSGPRYIVLPTVMEQLSEEERRHGISGYELQTRSSIDANFSRCAAIEFDKCAFAAQAVQHAVRNVSLAASVVSSVPPPNAAEMLRKLEQLLQPHTVAALQCAEQELMLLEQKQDEDITSYAARTQTLFNLLVRLGSVHSLHQRCLAWTRGLVSLSQTRKDLLLVLLPQTPSFEALMASARQFEQEDLAQQRLLARGRSQQQAQQQQPISLAPLANLANTTAEPDYSRYVCHSCNKIGHIASVCPERSQESRREHCGWCGLRGHLETACFKKKSGLPRAPPAGSAGKDNSHPNSKQASFAQTAAAGFVQANFFERAPVYDAAGDSVRLGTVAAAASGGGDRLRVDRCWD